MAPEAALLLLSVRSEVDPEADARIRSYSQEGVDWDVVLRLAHYHGVVAQLNRTLRTMAESVPGHVLQATGLAVRATELQNRFLAAHLVRLVDLIESEGLRAVAVKGPVLAERMYGDAGFRASRDLDFLVPKADVLSIRDLLIRDGFEVVKPTGPFGAREEDFELFHEITFGKPDIGLYVETQWSASNDRFHSRVDFNTLWSRLDEARLGGHRVRVLAPEDLLVFLSEHGTKHLWNRLKWVCDVAAVTRAHQKEGEELDWIAMLARARRSGAERAVLIGTVLARDLLGAELPDVVTARIQADAPARRLAHYAMHRLMSPAGADFGFASWRKCLFHARARERRADRVEHARRFVRYVASPLNGKKTDRTLRWFDYALSPFYIARRAVRHARAPRRRVLEPPVV